MGDDAPDLPLLRQAGLAVAVADAHPAALAAAHRRTRLRGRRGRGARSLRLAAGRAGSAATVPSADDLRLLFALCSVAILSALLYLQDADNGGGEGAANELAPHRIPASPQCAAT